MNVMIAVLASLVGVFIILAANEALGEAKFIKKEFRRKFTHFFVGIFVATWPTYLSWESIQLIGLAMVLVIYINRHLNLFKFNNVVRRKSQGDYFFAFGITLCALLTNSAIFFAIAILHLAIADTLAAIIGTARNGVWKYKIFGQNKTILGSMTFWLSSLYILGFGGLAANNQINFSGYWYLILLAPPLLTIVENISPRGLDNLTVPLSTLAALYLVAKL